MVSFFVIFRFRCLGNLTQTCRFADYTRIAIPRAPHEGFVVKTGRNKARYPIVDTSQIKPRPWPTVLTFRMQMIRQGQTRCQHIWLFGCPLKLNQRIRLFESRTHNPPRPVILKASCNDSNSVCQQRRCQRVTGVSIVVSAVKLKWNNAIPIYHTPRGSSAGVGIHRKTIHSISIRRLFRRPLHPFWWRLSRVSHYFCRSQTTVHSLWHATTVL